MTGLLDNLAGALGPMAAERAIFCPPPRPSLDAWMESGEYVLPAETSAVPGPYSFEYTPFFREPMRRLSHPPVKVGIEAGTQIGKSVCLNGVFGYCVRHGLGPILLTMPRETDTRRRVRTRIVPMFRSSPALLRLAPSGDVRNINVGEETVFGNGVIAFLAWAGSPAAMSDNPIMVALTDEPGKFQLIGATGENPFDLIDNRQRSYDLLAIHFYVTSPQDEDDLADKQFRSGSDARWHVPCHGCGGWHAIGASEQTLFIGKQEDGTFFAPAAYTDGGAPCWYQCPRCQTRWSEAHRALAVAAGVWVHKHQQISEAGLVTGGEAMTRHFTYRVNSMMIHPRFWSAKKEAARFVHAQRSLAEGLRAPLLDYVRNQQARPWKEVGRTVDGSALAERATGRALGTVPLWVKRLTAGADYHEDRDGNVRVDWLVLGWGEDLRLAVIATGEAASLDEMFMMTSAASWPWDLEGLEGEALQAARERPELMVTCGMVDAGYQPDDPAEGVVDVVYDFCMRYRGTRIWWPCRGGKPTQADLLVSRDLEKVVGEAQAAYRRKTAGRYRGMKLVWVAVSQFKDRAADWAAAPREAMGSIEFPAGMPDRYWKELANEHKIREKGRWVWKARSEGGASKSHGLDITVYALAAGFYLGYNNLFSQEALADPARAAAMRGLGPRRKPRSAVGGYLNGLPSLR